MKSFRRMALAGLVTMAVAGFTLSSNAQEETSFSGKVSSKDKSAQTFKVNKQTLQVLPTTMIVRNGRPAAFADIKEGDEISGLYKKSAEGKLELVSVRVGPKAQGDTKKGVSETKEEGIAFNGKVTSADKSAQTFVVRKQTFSILPTTPITKDGKPASFDDVKVGEEVVGQYKKSSEGKLELLSLDIGSKTEKTKKKKE